MKKLLLLLCLLPVITYGQTPQTKLVPIKPTFNASFQRSNPFQPRWSPKADYHLAVVIVRCPDGQGTGVMIQHTGEGVIVLTNRHVVRQGDGKYNPVFPRVTMISQNGNRFEMEVGASDPEFDVAILKSVDPEVHAKVSLPIANFEPPLGEDVELVGFGGPGNKTLRHFYGERLAKVELNAITIPGDSGSPLIYGGAVVGINYGGQHIAGMANGWNLIYPASSFISGPQLCQWVNDRCYQQWQCQPYIQEQPYYQPQVRPQPSQGYQFYPPSSTPDPSISTPSPNSPQTPTPPPPKVNQGLSDEQIDEIVQKVLAHPSLSPESLKGKDGKDGEQGPPGPQGEPGVITQEQINQLVMMVATQVFEQVQDQQPTVPSMEEIVNAVSEQVKSCNCEDFTQLPVDETQVPTLPGETDYLKETRILYFTANSCVACYETNNLVNSLKRAGYPITIITLTVSMAEAHQVPQIFVPDTKERAMGSERVKEFLSNLTN